MSNDGDPGGAKGRIVGGRYRLLERIGSGGMGTVWRARDELVEREVAVKQPRLTGDPEDESHRRAAHRLYREARAAARVDHPCAVTIHDVVVEEDGVGPDGGLPWIVMELIRGESLHEVLRRGPLEPAEAARVGLAVLGALRAAHAVGIVHRDVKPANVLLGPAPLSTSPERGHPHGRVVLTDFGIAHVQGEESLTAGGEFVGSLEFVAPERMSGRGAGPACDLWSLGVLLYTAVEGHSPFRRPTPESTLAAILATDPPEPKQAGPLAPLLTALLTRDPNDRPTAEETAGALERAAEGGSVSFPAVEGAGKDAEAQDAGSLRELGDDVGTLQTAGSRPTPAPRPRRPLHHRPLALALLTGVLVGGAWLGTSLLPGEGGSGAGGERTVTYASSAPAAPSEPAPARARWVAHREDAMDAVLSLPSPYRESARQGAAGRQPRQVVYSAGTVDIRLRQWDRAPAAPMALAAQAHETWQGQAPDARTQTTRTTFHGYDAALADTTYGLDDTPTRVMELFVRTADARLYELRVDMPKGTPDEKQGTTVFKQARDRLELGERPDPTP
ncbi:serine/threonine-protein kinase [Streptomyces sp. 3214.6]|uniref:serine/threonine-protein kinase n=1 Tax=Streptomyces sp. 3214.6 TaxID=1882757 RepID=UPI00090ABF23|nr:serine/threonine-protein kinase [Streptomyces sp. 3214.6]SHI04905.1 Serine/threonine protein kinase [Streptomyces sp. 3214.6]